MSIKKLDKFVLFVIGKILASASVVCLISLTMLFGGEFFYMLIEGMTFNEAVKAHFSIITAYGSPFEDPIKTHLGKIFGIIDLLMSWLLLPTILAIVFMRSETVLQFEIEYRASIKELYRNAYPEEKDEDWERRTNEFFIRERESQKKTKINFLQHIRNIITNISKKLKRKK